MTVPSVRSRRDARSTELVAAHPFCAGLERRVLGIVAGCARNVALAPGAMLCVEGESADTFYLLRRGRVSIEVHQPGHGPVVIETVGPGERRGLELARSARTAGPLTRARIEPVGAIAIDGACLRAKSLEDPALGYALLSRVARELSSALQATRLRLLDLYGAHRGLSASAHAARRAPADPGAVPGRRATIARPRTS